MNIDAGEINKLVVTDFPGEQQSEQSDASLH